MKLHESPDVFQELIQRTAVTYSIPEAYVEKDYWVTMTLKRLSESEFAGQVVFKGGTALSKAYAIIERFSEDIDLAAKCMDLGQGATKRLLKDATTAATVNLAYQPNHSLESKHGTFRKTVHSYPTQRRDDEFDQVSNHILLEINAFSKPEPSHSKSISSMIAPLLEQEGHQNLIEEYELDAFSLDVLSVERTLCEKIMGLVKACYQDDPIPELRRQIRHVYDICMILRNETYKRFILTDDFTSLIQTVRRSDRQQFKDADKWLAPPPHKAFIFDDPVEAWGSLSAEFHGSFSQMVFHNELPEDTEVISTYESLKSQLQRLDSPG